MHNTTLYIAWMIKTPGPGQILARPNPGPGQIWVFPAPAPAKNLPPVGYWLIAVMDNTWNVMNRFINYWENLELYFNYFNLYLSKILFYSIKNNNFKE